MTKDTPPPRPEQDTRNAVEFAADVVERVHGRPALATLATFLNALPSDACISWGDAEWAPAAVLAQQIEDASHG